MGFARAQPILRARRFETSNQILAHGIPGACTAGAAWLACFGISAGQVKAPRRLRAGQKATRVAALGSASFEGAQQGPADASKTCIRRNIVQPDHASVGDGSDGEDVSVFESDEN